MQNKIAHFCQNCRAANEPGDTSCHNCGTRLMIVTFPASHKHEEDRIPPTYYEDHLLERVSLLEFRLSQVTEQLAMAYEFISHQSESFKQDHLFISSFMEAVLDVEPVFSENLSDVLMKTYKRKKSELKNEDKEKRELEAIFASHGKNNFELFSHLVLEGIKLLKDNEEKQAFRTLERASLLSPDNVHLQILIAEKLFLADKFDLAKPYLNKAYELSPQNSVALLLLGVIYADEGETEMARKFVSVLATKPNSMVCANYIWGMLAAFENNWNEAIIAFKESVELVDLAELNYLIGSAYFQTQNYPMALEYLELAVLEDQKFADAWFMIYIIYGRLEKPTKSENARQMVFEARETGAKSLKFMSKNNKQHLECAIPFLHLKENKKRLLTDGSLRMTSFFRKLVSESID